MGGGQPPGGTRDSKSPGAGVDAASTQVEADGNARKEPRTEEDLESVHETKGAPLMLLNGLEANLRGSPRAGAVEGDQRPGPHDDPLIASNEATQTRDSAVNESQSGVAPEVSELGAGRYQVLRVLGEGGFGKIFLAQDTELDRKVAIKLPRFTAGDGSHVEEFRKEARLAASLKHPAIVTVHDVAWEKNGTVFVVMEYVDGKPLSHLLQTQRVPLKHAISLMTRIAEAVHHAHINGLLGRRRCRELAGVDSSDCSILGGRLGGAEGRPE